MKRTNKTSKAKTAGQSPALGLAHGSAVGGDFYNGMEWLAAWLVDHAEGETVTEELARQWAIDAWKEHVRREVQNVSDEPRLRGKKDSL